MRSGTEDSRALTGVEVSQGAISQDALRRAKGAVGDAYDRFPAFHLHKDRRNGPYDVHRFRFPQSECVTWSK